MKVVKHPEKHYFSSIKLPAVFKNRNNIFHILIGTTYIKFKYKEVMSLVVDASCVQGFYYFDGKNFDIFISFIHQ